MFSLSAENYKFLHDESGKIEFAYDSFGRVISEKGSVGTIEYSYNSQGLLSEKICSFSDSLKSEISDLKFSTKYTYDELDRIVKVSSQAGEYSYSYDKKGRIASLSFGGTTIQNTYDKAGRLTAKTFTAGGNKTQLAVYEYDKLDRRVKASVNGVEWIYTYDKYNQLTTASSSDGHIYGYSFDGIGNRLSDEKTKYAYNKLNQIVKSDIVKSDIPEKENAFAYDAYGNLTKTPDMECKYDLRNRLVEVKKADITVNYSYDPLGQRISSVEATAGGLKTTKFLMSGMVEQARVVDSVIQFHTLGLDLAQALTATGGVGAVLSSSEIRNSSFIIRNYLYDGNGNVISTCDSSGAITAKLAYSPFGEKISGPDLSFEFSTKPVDASGLAYYGFRFYSPQTGRWLSRDPLFDISMIYHDVDYYQTVPMRVIQLLKKEYAAEKKKYDMYLPSFDDFMSRKMPQVYITLLNDQFSNRYAYVDNDPIKYNDFVGLSKINPWDLAWEAFLEWLKEHIAGELKDKISEYVSKDRYDACQSIRCEKIKKDDSRWEATCQSCAELMCIMNSTTAIALKVCLDAKFSGCAMGISP